MSGFRNALCRYVINTHLTLIQCPGTSLVPQNLNRVHTHNCLRSNACVIAWIPTTSAGNSVPPSRPKILPHYVLLPASASAPHALRRLSSFFLFLLTWQSPPVRVGRPWPTFSRLPNLLSAAQPRHPVPWASAAWRTGSTGTRWTAQFLAGHADPD